MALFQDFSFSKPATRKAIYDDVPPQEEHNPSRSPSPFSSSSSNKRSSISDPIYDLSAASNLCTPISARLVGPDRRRNSLAREYFETIRARRQCAVRQQCDPRRASAIRLYVEGLMSEESTYPELHPSSVGMEFPLPRRSAPTTSFYECTPPSAGEAEQDEVRAMHALSIEEKIATTAGGQRLAGASAALRTRHSVQKSSKIKTKARVKH